MTDGIVATFTFPHLAVPSHTTYVGRVGYMILLAGAQPPERRSRSPLEQRVGGMMSEGGASVRLL